uniref:NADH-ubiquinone oxidoreductase chain 5 n=1 Tax=Axianassa australis TaxID=576642 RepID=A0A4Y5QJJ5_9EUCA|nr:NADH dehydrogenase subunit 5 [Axianassa australis]QCX31746.1 NADH dehydrogenase subunit 5 [Axianassa australis]
MNWAVSMYLSSMVFLMIGSVSCIIGSLNMMLNFNITVIEWEIFSLNSCNIVMTLIFDWMALMFLGFVLLISSMVLFYSGGYMAGDKTLDRFIYLVLGFVGAMVALIVSPNLVSILLGWDGLGLVSYALVIYYQNEKSANAGMITILSNRVGDVAILLSIAIMFELGGWNFIYYVGSMGDNMLTTSLSLLVILAAMTKSAQIPFSAWLPAAMAAPTPVSALVHSSTLVTAGVYLLIRFSPMLVNEGVKSFLLIISCLTMFMAGLGANFEYDLKKIIALSTLSQLGVMISILALGFMDLAFFHLLTHALFKALLFMCAGVIIHNAKEYQDIRSMGSLVECMPLTSMNLNLANFALCGFPFLAGFYSKDLILEVAFLSWVNYVSFLLYAAATGLTVCYTFRLVYYSLTGGYRLSSCVSVSDDSFLMTGPMWGLSVGAVFAGCCLSWLIFPDPYLICMGWELKTLPLMVSGLGALVGYMLNMMNVSDVIKSLFFYKEVVMAGSMWFMPFLSTFNLSSSALNLSVKVQKSGDGGWSEYLGGQGIYMYFISGSRLIQIAQDSVVKLFMKVFLIWVIVMMIFIF